MADMDRLKALQDEVQAAREAWMDSRIGALELIDRLDVALQDSRRDLPAGEWIYFVAYRHQVLTIDGEATYVGGCVVTRSAPIRTAEDYVALLGAVADTRRIESADLVPTSVALLGSPQ